VAILGPRFDVLRTGKALAALLAAAFLLVAGAAGYYALVIRPEYELVLLRGRAQLDLFGLYGLQQEFRSRHGAYSNDLETLLRSAPDGGAGLRASLQAHTHLDTLVVDGDAWRFKLEANVRDPERTLLRLSGPKAGDPKR
jgi:hypothetical protein